MSTDLVIGAPVYDRLWAMPFWFGHVEAACAAAHITPRYIFVADPRDKTSEYITSMGQQLGRQIHMVWVEEFPHEYVRSWSPDRYRRMVYLRNTLLDSVVSLGPDLFLSLDTDIFMAPGGVETLINAVFEYDFDLVGGKAFLTPPGTGTWAPTWANLGEGEFLLREDRTTLIACEVVMAIKLMTPSVFQNVRYEYHHQGEDIGFSKNAKAQGYNIGWDGRVGNKHVMHRDDLFIVDDRVGF